MLFAVLESRITILVQSPGDGVDALPVPFVSPPRVSSDTEVKNDRVALVPVMLSVPSMIRFKFAFDGLTIWPASMVKLVPDGTVMSWSSR